MIAFTFTSVAADHMKRRGLVAADMLGSIPEMISPDDPAGAVEQIDRAYRDVGGGWRDSSGLTLDVRGDRLRFACDPDRVLIASAPLRDERILFFDGAWIVVQQPDDSYRVARID